MKQKERYRLTRNLLHDKNQETPFFSDEELNDGLNEGDRESARELMEVGAINNTLEANGTIDLTAGTQEYALPTGCNLGEINRVEILADTAYSKLDFIDFSEIPDTESAVDTGTDVRGTPTKYYLRGGKMGFRPVPDTTTASNTPRVTVFYTARPTDITLGTTEPSLPEEWQHLSCYYAASYVSQGMDREQADFFMGRYLDKRRRMLMTARSQQKERYPRTRRVAKY